MNIVKTISNKLNQVKKSLSSNRKRAITGYGMATYTNTKDEFAPDTFVVTCFIKNGDCHPNELGLFCGDEVLAYTCEKHALKVKKWFEDNNFPLGTDIDYPDFVFENLNEDFQKLAKDQL